MGWQHHIFSCLVFVFVAVCVDCATPKQEAAKLAQENEDLTERLEQLREENLRLKKELFQAANEKIGRQLAEETDLSDSRQPPGRRRRKKTTSTNRRRRKHARTGKRENRGEKQKQKQFTKTADRRKKNVKAGTKAKQNNGKTDASRCDPENPEKCSEKEIKFIDTIKTKVAKGFDIAKEHTRLTKMKGKKMKEDLVTWLNKRLNIISQMQKGKPKKEL